MAIDVCRRAIKAIYTHTGKPAPVWVDDDSDPGFDKGPSKSGCLQSCGSKEGGRIAPISMASRSLPRYDRERHFEERMESAT
jgi:hypothetical protein